MKREEFIDLDVGTTELVLKYVPSRILLVARGGGSLGAIVMSDSQYNYTNKTVTLTQPVGSENGSKKESFIILYTT